MLVGVSWLYHLLQTVFEGNEFYLGALSLGFEIAVGSLMARWQLGKFMMMGKTNDMLGFGKNRQQRCGQKRAKQQKTYKKIHNVPNIQPKS